MPLTSNSDSYLNLDSLYGLICFEGPQAIEFLQRQLSCDLGKLTAGEVLPGAWLNPAGRVIATLDLIEQGDKTIALVPQLLTEQVVAGISRYLLNAKLTISQSDLHLLGSFERESANGCDWPGGRRIFLCREPGVESTEELLRWQRIDITDSLIRLDQASSAGYLPQMLELESRGAINYDKGCFPGQEVVARTHYLGKVKRSLVRLQADQPLAVGTAILNDQGQPMGEIIQFAPGESGGGTCLAVLKAGPETPMTASGVALRALQTTLAEAPFNG